jgi:P-type conjugative transfer protein TrbL
MDTTILDTIATTFVSALQAGQSTLTTFSLPLLGVLAIITFYVQVGPLVASGGVLTGDVLAGTLLTVLKVGVFYWLMQNFVPLANAAFDTFLQWGVAPGGMGVSAETFRAPSAIIDVGFRIATPIRDFTDNLVKWAALWKWPTLLTYALTYYVILLSFAFIALHLMMTIIEYNLAVMVGLVLVPWGVLSPTAFFSEFSIGWVTGGLVRVLVTAAMVGMAIPLFDQVRPNMTGGNDPTFFSAIVCGLASLVFAILSWVIPGRAAAIAGRGVSLAIHGGTLVAGAAGAGRGVLLLTTAIRGVSQLLRR